MKRTSRSHHPTARASAHGDDVRPIGARPLKSAGDTLRPYLEGARVLDLFAGHGRLGLMTLEEGAASVRFIERHRERSQQIAKAAARYGERAEVVLGDVFLQLARETAMADIVFADPPFPLWSDEFSSRLFTSVAKVMAPGAILLVKCPKRVVPSFAVPALDPWKTTPFGESTLRYYRMRG